MKRADAREAVLRAALALGAERGFGALTAREVRQAAGVSNGSFFHHFPTMSALESVLHLQALSGYHAALVGGLDRATSVRDGVRGLVLDHARWVLEHGALAVLLHEHRRVGPDVAVDTSNRELLRRVRGWLAPHVAAGTVRALPADALAAVLFGPIHALTHGFARGDEARVKRVAPVLADAAWAALATGGPPCPSAEARPPRWRTTYQGVVYPWHCDHMGHMNVTWYTAKFDEATWGLFAGIGITAAYIRTTSSGMVAVRQVTEYRAELLAGETVAVRSRILEARPKVLRFVHELVQVDGDTVAATSELTGVHVDLATRRSREIPSGILDRARELAEGE